MQPELDTSRFGKRPARWGDDTLHVRTGRQTVLFRHSRMTDLIWRHAKVSTKGATFRPGFYFSGRRPTVKWLRRFDDDGVVVCVLARISLQVSVPK